MIEQKIAYHNYQKTFLVVSLLGVLLVCFLLFRPYLGALFVALALAVVLHPWYNAIKNLITKIIPWKQGLIASSTSAVLIVIIAIALLILPMALIGMQLFGEVWDVYQTLSSSSDLFSLYGASQWLDDSFGIQLPSVTENATVYAQQIAGWLAQNISGVFSSVGKVFLSLFIGLLALFYFLRDGHLLRQMFVELSPLPNNDNSKILENLTATINAVVRGSLIIAIAQGIFTAIGFVIFGVPNATLWGSVTAIVALIPALGTIVVVTPAVIYLFFQQQVLSAIGLAVWGVIGMVVIDNTVGPQLIRQGLAVHPFIVLLSVLGGITLFGPIGFLAGPLIVSLLVAILSLYTQRDIVPS
jgi:predicted PurR-regulated permease PerM